MPDFAAIVTQLVQYYQGLLILQYLNKPKAQARVAAVATPLIMDALPLQVMMAYALPTAVGDQLDVLGKYAGVVRTVKTFTATVVLDDDDFRQLIYMKIFRNNTSASLYDIDRLILQFFPGVLQAFDTKNMHMSYAYDASVGSQDLAEAFIELDLLPRPLCVQLGALVYVANLSNIFGARTYQLAAVNRVGLGTYAYPQAGTTLTYANILTP